MSIPRFLPLGIAIGALALPVVSPAQREDPSAPRPAGQADPAPAATPARAIPPQPPRKVERPEAPRREAVQPTRGKEASSQRDASSDGRGGTLGERPAAPVPSAPSKVVTAGEAADPSATPAADKDSPLLRPPADTLPGRPVAPAAPGMVGVPPVAGSAPQPPAAVPPTQGVVRPETGKVAPVPAAQPAAPIGDAKPAPAAGAPR